MLYGHIDNVHVIMWHIVAFPHCLKVHFPFSKQKKYPVKLNLPPRLSASLSLTAFTLTFRPILSYFP